MNKIVERKGDFKMVQKNKLVLVSLNEYTNIPPAQSQCWKCALLIDGICDMTCQKHSGHIPPEYWDNKKTCPNRKEKE